MDSRRILQTVAETLAFIGTVALVQALRDEYSTPRRWLREWSDHFRDRRLFSISVQETIDHLPEREEA